MRLSNKTVKVLASTVYYQGGEVTIIRRGQKSTRIQKPDGSQRVVYNSELADLPQKPGSYFDDSESDDLKDEIPKENRQHTPNSQVQKSGPDPKANAYYPVPLTQALQIIKDKGFRQRSQPRTFTSATLTTWENPVTQQLAQVKHEFKELNLS